MGASVVISINNGAGNTKKALLAEGNAFFLLFTGSVLLTLILLLSGRPLLVILGAKGEILSIALTYLHYILIGGIIQVFAAGMVPLMRNHGASFYAMCSMAVGCITNILLDYYLVIALRMGIKGATLATVLGQILTLLMCGTFFMQKKHRIPLSRLKPDFTIIKSILRVALSPFGLTYLPSITIIFMNLQALKYGGEEAVSAYAVLAYIISFMELLVQGIGDGSQPLFSLSKGSGDQKSLKTYAKWTFLLGISFGIAGAVAFFLSQDLIPVLYGTSGTAAVSGP